MGLQQRRGRREAGWPELVAVLLVGAATVPAMAWWRSHTRPAYQRATGRILDCEIRPTHYNAADHLNKVSLTYEYAAVGETHTGRWQGFWPAAKSPNALPPARLDALRAGSFPLVVLYDPTDPARSTLHYASPGAAKLYGGLALLAVVLALLYVALLYPAWKARGPGG